MKPNPQRQANLRIEMRFLEGQEQDIQAKRAEVERLIQGALKAKEQVQASAPDAAGRLYVLDARAKRNVGRVLPVEDEKERQALRDLVEGPDRTAKQLGIELQLLDSDLSVVQGRLLRSKQELDAQDEAAATVDAAEVEEAKAAVERGNATHKQKLLASGLSETTIEKGGAYSVTI